MNKIGDCHLEHCWVLTGDEEGKLWWANMHNMTVGSPVSVGFDADYVLKLEESQGNVCGLMHSHPGMVAVPSVRDYETMWQWVTCFGKSLVCVILGVDGLRGYWFDDDESEPTECQVKMFGNELLVGTTEVDSLPPPSLSLEDDPNARPIEEFLPEDERAEWKDYVKEIQEGGYVAE